MPKNWRFSDSTVQEKQRFVKNYHEIAKRHLQGLEKRIPILLNLSKFPRISADIEGIIISHLARVCNVQNPSWEGFRKLNDSGFLLLIFDGLDEMAVRTSKEVVEDNMREIAKLANAQTIR